MADFITEFRDRRILPAVGVYVASVWVLIEILDRLVERYLLSPYLSDIVFWGLYSLIPAVMLVAWTHGKPGKDKATRLEKVGVPINLIATLGLLITVFGDKNFDLAATQITVSNELGQQETHYIPSETFRRRMAVFFWTNESGDEELDWLQYGVTELLVQDLQQDPFVLATSPWNNFGNGFYSRMRRAGFNDGLNVPRSLMRKIANEANRQYFVEGSLNRTDGNYMLTARVWDTQTLDQINELSEHGSDIYTVVDRLSKDIRHALGVPESSKRIAEDLPLKETYGESSEALKAYIQGLNARLFNNDFAASNAFFDQVTSIDPGFVLGWFQKAGNLIDSGNLPGAQEAYAKAQELDYRLPARDRAQLKAMVYRLAGDHEKMMSFLYLQAQIRDDASSHNNLANILMITGELEEAKKESLLALERDALNAGIYLRMSTLERATGNMDAAIDYARKYQEQKPEDIEANLQLGDLLRDSGDLDAAEQHYKQAQILQNSPVRPTLKLASIASRKGDIPAARQYLSEADRFAQTPADKILVLQGAVLLELRLGRISEAIRQTYAQEEFLRQSRGLLDLTLSIYTPLIDYYVFLGDFESARSALNTATGLLTPPLDKFLAFNTAFIQAKEHDVDAARASLQQAREVMEQFQLNYLQAQIHLIEVVINEVQEDFVAMAQHCTQAIEQINQSVVANEMQIGLSQIYAQLARAQTRLGKLDAADQSIETGFHLDPSEPVLWVEKARLQQARNMPQLALASVNYALAIWKDADEDYVELKNARSLAAELQSQ
jgi:tetratricopeptide (TPR) repeat protein/TolB-like protein